MVEDLGVVTIWEVEVLIGVAIESWRISREGEAVAVEGFGREGDLSGKKDWSTARILDSI